MNTCFVVIDGCVMQTREDEKCTGLWSLECGKLCTAVALSSSAHSVMCGLHKSARCHPPREVLAITPVGARWAVPRVSARTRSSLHSPQQDFESWVRRLHRMTPRGFRPVGAVQGKVVGCSR